MPTELIWNGKYNPDGTRKDKSLTTKVTHT